MDGSPATIRAMAYDPPEDLLRLRRDFLAAERRLSKLGKAMPAPTAVAAGEAEVPDEQRQEWWTVQAECRRLAMGIQTHSWWATADNRQKAWMALHTAAMSQA
jgi:hypothetical protein